MKWFLLVLVACIAGVGLYEACGRWPRIIFPLRKDQYEKVISRLRTDKDAFQSIEEFPNVLVLPPDLKRASRGGSIYFKSLDRGNFAVAFKVLAGKGYNMSGYLYVSRPLRRSEIVTNYYGQRVFDYGGLDLVIEGVIDANWYIVSYRLD